MAAGNQIVSNAKLFLRGYAKLAELSYLNLRPLFVYKPKLHYFHHLVMEMQLVLAKGGTPLNPLAYSCSAAEDFIGRASMLSRRASARTTEKRVLQRYLAAAKSIWDNDKPNSEDA